MAITDTSSTSFPNALERALPDLMLIPASALRLVNLDITAMVVTIMGTLPVLRELRPAIVAALGEAFGVHIDELETYAQAVSQTRANYLIAATPADVQAVSDEVVAKRDMLFADVMPLVKRKLIAQAELGELRGNVGFRNQVLDLMQLIAVFRKHWAAIAPFTAVKAEDLESADALAKRFVHALGAREQGPAPTAELADLNQRAFTKAVDTYDQVRRAVSFLRWDQDDVESIVPSLWAGRGSRRRDAESPSTPTPTEPSVPVVATPVPAGPAVPPGLPGNSPFAQ